MQKWEHFSFKFRGQLTVDNEVIDLLGDRQSHLRLPDNFITIYSNFRRTKSSSNSDSKTNTAYYQDEHVLRADGGRGRELHVVGRERRLEDPPQPLRHKTPDKGKLKATLPDIKTSEDSNRRLKKKIMTDLTLLRWKKAELEKFFKFNVIKSLPHAPRCGEVMRTTWVINEKVDNLSKKGSKIKARLCTMGKVGITIRFVKLVTT